jgi:hypothetical protein
VPEGGRVVAVPSHTYVPFHNRPSPTSNVHIPPSTPRRECYEKERNTVSFQVWEAESAKENVEPTSQPAIVSSSVKERRERGLGGGAPAFQQENSPDASISATVAFQSLRSTSGESSTRIACNDTCGMNTTSSWGNSANGKRSDEHISACHTHTHIRAARVKSANPVSRLIISLMMRG